MCFSMHVSVSAPRVSACMSWGPLSGHFHNDPKLLPRTQKAAPPKGHMHEAQKCSSCFFWGGTAVPMPVRPLSGPPNPTSNQNQNTPTTIPTLGHCVAPLSPSMSADTDPHAEGIDMVASMEGLPEMLVVMTSEGWGCPAVMSLLQVYIRKGHLHGQLPQAMWEMRRWYHRDAWIQQPKLYTAIRNRQQAPGRKGSGSQWSMKSKLGQCSFPVFALASRHPLCHDSSIDGNACCRSELWPFDTHSS